MIRLEKLNGDTKADKEIAEKYVEPISDLRRLVLERARESEDGGDLILHFDRFLLGVDEDGDQRVTRYFALPTAKPPPEETAHQDATSTKHEGTESESDEGRADGGQFAEVISDEEILGMIFLKSPKIVKDLADEDRPGMALPTIKRRITKLRKEGLIHEKSLGLTPAGVARIGDMGIGTAIWDGIKEEPEE